MGKVGKVTFKKHSPEAYEKAEPVFLTARGVHFEDAKKKVFESVRSDINEVVNTIVSANLEGSSEAGDVIKMLFTDVDGDYEYDAVCDEISALFFDIMIQHVSETLAEAIENISAKSSNNKHLLN